MSAGDNGSMTWWDWKTGLPFMALQDTPQPGSLDAESGIFCSTFDQTGTRLITGGADKTIKVSQTTYPRMLLSWIPFRAVRCRCTAVND